MRSRIAAVLLAVGLAGCVSSREYHRPPPGYAREIPRYAERACVERARRDRLDVRRFHRWRQVSRWRWETVMTVRDYRRDRLFDRGCRYDERRDRASLFRP